MILRGAQMLVIGVLGLALMLLAAAVAAAHGGGDEMTMEGLTKQPARILAQQAIAELRVRGDRQEAAVRLDAALESRDKSDVDMVVLRKATETLDGGDPEGAVPLIDQALSRPLGAQSGKALHEAGREFQPGTGAQEVVAIISGAVLLIVGVLLLLRAHRRTAAQ